MNVNLFVLSLIIFLQYVSCKKRCTKPKGNVGDVRYDECIEFRCLKVKGKAKWIKSPAWEHCCVYNGKLFEPNHSIITKLNVSSECAVTLICEEGGITEVLLSSEEHHEDFVKQFNKTYASVEEFEKRKKIFHKRNHKRIKHNKLFDEGKVSWKEGIHEHSDLTDEEFISKFTGASIDKNFKIHISDEMKKAKAQKTTVPSSFSWRDQGGVTPIKNQGQCGSCVTFGTVAPIETCFWRYTNDLVTLSEKQLLDCGYGKYDAHGCSGAQLNAYFNLIKNDQNGRLYKESCYPYAPQVDTCQVEPSCTYEPAVMKDYSADYDVDEELLKKYIYVNPVETGVNANCFMNYQSGIYSDATCTGNVNHAVAIVGYGTENGVDYWEVKNSWGTWWGENGYIRIKRGGHVAQIGTYVYQPSCEQCQRHYDMSDDEWYPIIDCREELNLAITPGDSVNSAVHTKAFDPTNDRQLWRQDKEGRIYNKHNGLVWVWDGYGSRFEGSGTAFFWSFNDCFKSSWNPPRVYLQSLSDEYGKGQRCINMANVNDKDGTNLMLFPCDSMNPPNGCFKFKL